MEQPQLLEVYSASAGAGKTFNLAFRVIDMLIANPLDYEHILAVTFTNKATAEMKNRILEKLYYLSDPQSLKHKETLADLRSHEQKLDKDKVPYVYREDDVVIKNCQIALIRMLNDYSQFSVSTIDSFVQKVIRAFAYENDFRSNYGIELDDSIVISAAIDRVMALMEEHPRTVATPLPPAQRKQLKDWMFQFVHSRMDEDQTWSVDSDIFNLAKVLTTDEGRDFVRSLSRRADAMADIDNMRRASESIIRAYEKDVKAAFLNFHTQGVAAAYNSDKIGRANGSTGSYFDKLHALAGEVVKDDKVWKGKAYDYLLDKVLKFEELRGKMTGKKGCDEAYIATLNGIFTTFSCALSEGYTDYCSAKAIVKNCYVMGILSHISDQMNKWATENNVMLMVKSNELLNRLIDNSPVPFIYEKIGTKYNSIMIDEFQDTSKMQYSNFIPLLANSLDAHNSCLLVGDVKQAIYRWRNSDWRLLANRVSHDFPGTVHDILLDTNFRSQKHVIEFNNSVFELMKSKMCDWIEQEHIDNRDIADVFKDCIQNTTGKKTNGYVEATFVTCNSKTETDVSEALMREAADRIAMLVRDYGYTYGDMAILVRSKIEGARAIDMLSSCNIPFVSNDSLLVCEATAVKAIVSALKYISNQKNLIALLTFSSIRNTGMDAETFTSQWNNQSAVDSEALLALRGKDLLEMVNSIVSLLPWDEVIVPDFIFVEAFIDNVRNYMTNSHVNLSDFIEYLSRAEEDMKVVAPEGQNAVTIITIHKSKGLEYPVVLMPFTNWHIDKARDTDIVWVDKVDGRFAAVEPLPVQYSKELLNTHFASVYESERLLRVIDNMNLIYVALTRAVDILMIWGACPVSKDGKGSGSDGMPSKMSNILNCVVSDIAQLDLVHSEEAMELESESDSEASELVKNRYTYGRLVSKEDNSNKGDSAERHPTKVELKPYRQHGWNEFVNLAKVSKEQLNAGSAVTEYIEDGLVRHDIMASIKTLDDIDRAVDEAAYYSDEGAHALKEELRVKLSSSEVKPWFDVDAKCVFNEQTFFTGFGEKRPDRIVISPDGNVTIVDYKFGDTMMNEKYSKQVRGYIQIFRTLGFKNVSGYIWYYKLDKIVKVN